MALYEHVIIARQDISPQQAEALNDTRKSLIEAGGGRAELLISGVLSVLAASFCVYLALQ